MLKLTFDDDWMEEYWSEIEPQILTNLAYFQNKERWIDKSGNYEKRLNEVAANLPQIANLPIDEKTEETAECLIEILYYLPLKTSLAALSWLTALNKENISWSYVCQIHAMRIIDKKTFSEESNLYIYSHVMAKRIQLFCWLKELEEVAANDAALRDYISNIKDI